MFRPFVVRSPLALPGGGAPSRAGSEAPRAEIPFVRAAHKHSETAFDSTNTPGATAQQLGPFDVPAYGFARFIDLYVSVSGAVLGTGTLAADFPWNIIQEVTLLDTNGHQIYGPVTGYQCYLSNLLGGYAGYNDPALDPDFVGTINAVFILRIPIEITGWDGFGSLMNQNQGSPFRVRITLAPFASQLSVVGTATAGPVRIRGRLQAWSQPAPVDMLGQAQQMAPPGHGAVQFWSVTTPVVNSGRMQIRLPRVGNLIRNLIFVHRTAAGLRDATVEPDDFSFTWDQRQIHVDLPSVVNRSDVRRANNLNLPTGVQAFQFTDDQDGTAGFENRHLWLPTVQATRLEYEGTFGAAGSMEILTNDVRVTTEGR